MNTRFARSRATVIALGALLLSACGESEPEMQMDHSEQAAAPLPEPDSIPQLHQVGMQLFEESCMTCHGKHARGTDQGPPLVHIYYEPNHHADIAFLMAVQNGVQAHHWQFGNMPPVSGRTPEEVAEITAYVRFLQRDAGIY